MENTSWDNLREKLNNHYSWPSIYLFKFIIPNDESKTTTLISFFQDETDKINLNSSSTGKYTSVSVHKKMNSAEEIIEIYEKATKIEGIIAL